MDAASSIDRAAPGPAAEVAGQTFEVEFRAAMWDRTWILFLAIPVVCFVTPLSGLVVAIALVLAVIVLRRARSRGRKRLHVDAMGIHEDGKLLFRGNPPRLGYVCPLPSKRCEVRLLSGSGRRLCTLVVSSSTEAILLLQTLSLDASRSVVTLWLTPRWGFLARLVTQVVISFVVWSSLRGGISAAWPWLLGLPFAVALTWPRKIRIGNDGVRVSWLAWHRFYSHASVRLVTDEKRGLRLTLRDGSSVLLPSNSSEALLSSILGARASDPPTSSAVGTLERQGRTTDRWLASLGALRVSLTPGYRDVHLNMSELWPILESSAYSPTTKAAAALALRGSLRETDRARLKRAEGSYAAPALAKVMEVVADAEASDGELVAAVEGVERC